MPPSASACSENSVCFTWAFSFVKRVKGELGACAIPATTHQQRRGRRGFLDSGGTGVASQPAEGASWPWRLPQRFADDVRRARDSPLLVYSRPVKDDIVY